MNRDTWIAIKIFRGLNKFKDIPLVLSIFHQKIETLYFKILFKKQNDCHIIDRFPSELPIDISPVFVLSTGRCGTVTLTSLMSLSPAIQAYHEPNPKLVSDSYLYYNNLMSDRSNEFWNGLIIYARRSLMLRAHWLDRVYFESNNRITLLADLIISNFPKAKFVHLIRHPYDFVRSAMNNGYYKYNSWDFARIHPLPTENTFFNWNDISRIEKCAWLWNQTNLHILKILEKVNYERKLFLKAEDIFSCNFLEINKLFGFVCENKSIPERNKIKKILKKKLNPSRTKKIGKPEYWSIENIRAVQKYTSKLMIEFGYVTK